MRNKSRLWLSLEQFEDRTAPSVAPVGGEFQVNTYTTEFQSGGRAALNQAGDFVVTWVSNLQDGDGFGVYAQRYNSVGQPLGGEFRVNSYTIGLQSNPSVAMDPTGDFVIAWSSYLSTGSGAGIYAQRYNPSGVAQGAEFRVSTNTTSLQTTPIVGMDQAGNFVIVWTSSAQDGSGDGIYAQRFNSSGQQLGGEFRVNTYTSSDQFEPSVAMSQAGDFVVTWTSGLQEGSDWGVYAQRYNSAGAPQGGEFRVNSYTTGRQAGAKVAMDQAGDFVVTWGSSLQDSGGWGVYAQRYNSGGQSVGGEVRINTHTTGTQIFSGVAMNPAGDFVVTWQSNGQDGSAYGIYAQAFRADGSTDGNEFRVNTYTTSLQFFPSIGMNQAGDFVVAWTSDGQDGSINGAYAQRYKLTTQPQVSAVQINAGAAQRSRLTELAVTFSAQVTFAATPAAAFTLTRNADGAVVAFTANVGVVGGVTVVTLNNFSGPATQSGSLADGRYTLTALASQITANGQQMAANYTFGDADGLFRYFGDTNGDRRVDISDFGIFSLAYLSPANYNAALDFNNDGRIDIADFGQFSVRYFTTLP